MRIFVTGASGYVGSAAAKDMLAAGHEGIGLVRPEESVGEAGLRFGELPGPSHEEFNTEKYNARDCGIRHDRSCFRQGSGRAEDLCPARKRTDWPFRWRASRTRRNPDRRGTRFCSSRDSALAL